MTKSLVIPSVLYYLPRRLHVFSTAAAVFVILKGTQLLNKLLRRTPEQVDDAWSSSNRRAASLILRTASVRRGLWIKCCQYLAARADALPAEYAEVLSKSLDSCPPTPSNQVTELVNESLASSPAGEAFTSSNGRPPIVSDFFSEFDPSSPIASASIAQVHVAVERQSGRKVVLKVQHPHIRTILMQDVLDLTTILGLISRTSDFDLRPIMDAWIENVPLETDFNHERSNLNTVRSALANAPDNLSTTAYVPEPLPQYSSEKVFVMEYVDGIKISDIHAMSEVMNAVQRARLIDEISKSFAIQLFLCNTFSGDPHPGNFLVHRLEDGGHPVLLDFGICVTVTAELRMGFARLFLAAAGNDSYSLVQALADVGLKLNRADPTAALDIMRHLLRTTASTREESINEQRAFRDDLTNRDKTIRKNEADVPVMDSRLAAPQTSASNIRKKNPADAFPGHLVFFFRSLGMLRGLAVSSGVKHSYLDTLRPYAEHVMLASVPVPQRMSTPVYAPIYTNGGQAKRAAKILQKAITKLYEFDMLIGMQIAVYKDDKLVLSLAAGRMGRHDPRPVREDTLFNSFSTTKGLSAILFASIQDEFGIEYGDLVTKYWPEFGQAGKASTTIAHILSHTSGLAQSLPNDMSMPRLRDDWEGVIRHFETAKPSHEPGTKVEYHALTFGWLVAGLMMKITGRTYQEILNDFVKKAGLENECFCGTLPEELLPDVPGGRVAALSSHIIEDVLEGPIGKALRQRSKTSDSQSDDIDDNRNNSGESTLEDTANTLGGMKQRTNDALGALQLPAADRDIPAYLLDPNFFNHPVLRAAFIPSANGHFSARALARLYGAVASDGVIGGVRVLEKGRAAKMLEKHSEFTHKGRRAWGAGLALYDCMNKRGRTQSFAAVGHGGIGGSMAFCIPEKRFSMAVTLNKLNALSVASASAIAIVCKSFGVPTPEWYYKLMQVAMASIKNKEVDEDTAEAILLERLSQGFEGDSDIAHLLVG